MIIPDVNVVLYAYRVDAPDHRRHRDWLGSVVNGTATFGMSPQVLSSVVRIATHSRIYARPDPLEDVLTFVDAILKRPNCQVVEPGPRHWEVFCDYCRLAKATGNLIPDAWFAALAAESECEWITLDRDFARFPGLRWRAPF